jgi:hypothetical protein
MRRVSVVLCMFGFGTANAADLRQSVRLLGADGAPLTGTRAVEVRLQDDQAIGSPDAHCWTSGPLSTAFEDGYATVALTGVPDSCWTAARWLAFLVDGTELGPRQPVLDVPRARRAPVAVEHFNTGSASWSPAYSPITTVTPIPQLTRTFATSRTATIHACYSLTCSFAGSRAWIGFKLDGVLNETGWFESDLNLGAHTVNACATWPNVAAGASHTMLVEMNRNPAASTSCWRGKLDIDVYYTE